MFTLGELAEALGAVLEGDPARAITGVAPLESAGPDDISFLIHERYRPQALASRAGALLVGHEMAGLPGPLLRCRAPQLALIDLLMKFHPAPAPARGVAPSAVVASDARIDPTAAVGALVVVEREAVIGPGVVIYPLAYVGRRAEIGAGSVLHPRVVLGEGVRLGRRVIVHPGAVIGADGFGYAFDGRVHRKIPQVGTVVIEDDVEVGANTTIDRATLGATRIGRGTKIDNLVMVAHNVEIGEDALLAAQAGVAGSARIGNGVVLAGQAGVADHVTIGAGAMLAAQAGVSQDVEAGARLTGTWARPVVQARRIWLAESELPELVRRVRALERRVAELEGRQGGATGGE